MTILHSTIVDADCHEPKHFTSALTTDAGKVLTPSNVTPGISVLRQLASTELSDTAALTYKAQGWAGLPARVTPQAFATSLLFPLATSDSLAVTVTAAFTVSAPTGTPVDGQTIEYRLTQGTTGTWVATWASGFRFAGGTPLVLSTAAGALDRVRFSYNAARSTWDCILASLNT